MTAVGAGGSVGVATGTRATAVGVRVAEVTRRFSETNTPLKLTHKQSTNAPNTNAGRKLPAGRVIGGAMTAVPNALPQYTQVGAPARFIFPQLGQRVICGGGGGGATTAVGCGASGGTTLVRCGEGGGTALVRCGDGGGTGTVCCGDGGGTGTVCCGGGAGGAI